MNRIIMGIVFLVIISWQRSQAQTELSLADAIRIGLERNYDIQIEKKYVDISKRNNTQGEAGRFPTINATLSQNNSLSNNVKTASPFQLQDEVISSSITPGVALDWTLFSGFRVNISKTRLDRLQQESEENAQVVIANTIQALILGYFNAVLENERREEFEKQLNLSRDRYNYVKIKAELGTAVSSDLLLEETNYLTDSTNFINQTLAYRNALRNLNILLAEPDIDKDYHFHDSLMFEHIDYKYEELASRLNSQNVDLRKQYIMQSIVKSDLALRRSDRYPTLTLQAGYNDARSRVDLSRASIPSQEGGSTPGPAEPLSAITDTYFANLSLSFTLFNGRKINRAIKNAMVQEDIGNLEIERLRNSLNKDLLESLDDYNTRRQIHAISERRYLSASKNLELTEEKFKGGTINSFDFRIVQNDQLAAATQRLQALYNLIDANVSIMRLTGGIVESYLK
jgi:outer membrane protein